MSAVRRLSWAGISFEVPANWELGLYKYMRRGVRRVEVEDEFSVRIEIEWVCPRRPVPASRVMQRYEGAARKMAMKADRRETIEGLPRGWTATIYRFSESVPRRRTGGLQVVKHALVTAFYLAPDSGLFAFCMLHFLPEDTEDPETIARLLAESFRRHGRDAVVPWELFDITLELPGEFLLEGTRFDVGAKLMMFRWRLRRFYLWHFSCADRFLNPGDDPMRWFASFVNDAYAFRGGHFAADPNGVVRWKRRRRHMIGHRDEIARWCFHYKLAYRLEKETNRMIAWVFNYRDIADFDILPPDLRFDQETAEREYTA